MGFTADVFSVTTLLLVAFALFVIYIRTKNWLDSNVPIIYYVAMITYVKSIDNPRLPLWIVLVGFALGGLLRFEFMNTVFTRIIKALEMVTLAVIIYLSLAMILQP
ncbi:MAG TPA: hypothetical protein VIX89_02750 [Bryobacteraceae bacterium]